MGWAGAGLLNGKVSRVQTDLMQTSKKRPRYNLDYASLVQLVERRSPKPDVEGSSPSGRELHKGSKNDWYRRKFIAGMA